MPATANKVKTPEPATMMRVRDKEEALELGFTT